MHVRCLEARAWKLPGRRVSLGRSKTLTTHAVHCQHEVACPPDASPHAGPASAAYHAAVGTAALARRARPTHIPRPPRLVPSLALSVAPPRSRGCGAACRRR
eukprot:4748690-Prymnesium_polylepis.1